MYSKEDGLLSTPGEGYGAPRCLGKLQLHAFPSFQLLHQYL